MKEWCQVRLGEILTRSDETVALSPDATYREITVKLWGKGVVPRGTVSGSEVAAQRRYVARHGQLILSRIDARNGAVGIVPPELDGAIVTSDFPVFRVAEHCLLPAYLGWLSRTASFVEKCRRASEGTTNRVRLQEDKFLAMEIPLPPLAEQRRLVARIDQLGAQIREARALRRQAAEEAQALSQATIETKYHRLRRQFGTQPLKDVCESITDGDHNTPTFANRGVRFIFVGNVSSGRLHFDTSKWVTADYFRGLKPSRVPNRGDILYTAVGATLGIPSIVDSDEPFCFQRHLAILKPNRHQVDARFVWHMLRSRTVYETAWASTTGSAQPTIPLHAIRGLLIPVPPLHDQQRIASELDALQYEIDSLRSFQAELRDNFAALLPVVLDLAFKGKLALHQNPYSSQDSCGVGRDVTW